MPKRTSKVLPLSPEFVALKKKFTERFYFSDPDVVDVVLGVYAGNHLPSDPLWIYLIAPPSAGKTELLVSLSKCPDHYPLSDMTVNALISGWKDEQVQSDKPPRRRRVRRKTEVAKTSEETKKDNISSEDSSRAEIGKDSKDPGAPRLPPKETPTPGTGDTAKMPDVKTGHDGGTPTPQEYSLLPKLDGKTLVTKDFTILYSKPTEVRNQILAILRDAYDGSMSRAFGNSAPKRFVARFNYLAGMTPDIEKVQMLTSLGDRFLMYRIQVKDRLEHARQALRNALEERSQDNGREMLQQAVKEFMDWLPRIKPEVNVWMQERIIDLAEILAVGRAIVERNRNDEVLFIPSAELCSRVAKQLARLAQSLALVRGRGAVTSEELRVVKRVVLDTLPVSRRKLLHTIWQHRAQEESADTLLQNITCLAKRTLQRDLDNLSVLGFLTKNRRQELLTTGKPAKQGGEKQAKVLKNYYQLSERFLTHCNNIGGIEDYEQ